MLRRSERAAIGLTKNQKKKKTKKQKIRGAITALDVERTTNERGTLRLRPSPSLKLWSSRLLQQPLNATDFISHEAPLHHQLIKLTDSQKKWSVNIIFRFVLFCLFLASFT